MKQIAAFVAAVALSACATAPAAVSPQDAFFANLRALCGQTFAGRVVTTDAADADFARSQLMMHVRDCSANEVRIPFWVGENRSRTWVVTRTASGVRLKHDHRHEDGTEDELSRYGGVTVDAGTETRQQFPVDAYSRALFTRRNATVSNTNVWAVEVQPDRVFAYELRRPNRYLRVEFDLTKPLIEVVAR